MNVLSLFDGMSCGLTALKRAGIKVNNYYASEIDKWAIKIAKKNHPEIQHIGDINDIEKNKVGAQRIDLILAGPPCQGFSCSGSRLDFGDPRSLLFFKAIEILRDIQKINPDVKFLIENVSSMKKHIRRQLTELLEIEPIEINSSLLSAQNRARLYWTNFSGTELPQDKNIQLKDILECETENYIKISKIGIYKKHQNKASCLTGGAKSAGNHSSMDLIGRPLNIGEAEDLKGFESIRRIYSVYGKSPTLLSNSGGNRHVKVALNDYQYRRLTPIECERLQTLDDNYTEGVSNTQRYKMIGNGWTVDVISHILRGLIEDHPPSGHYQLSF